jgi:hypothetical protein
VTRVELGKRHGACAALERTDAEGEHIGERLVERGRIACVRGNGPKEEDGSGQIGTGCRLQR